MDKKKKVTMRIMKQWNRFLEEAVLQSVLEIFWTWKSPEKSGPDSVLKLL